MRSFIVLLIAVFIYPVHFICADDFVPERLVLDASDVVGYSFDGSTFELPVRVTGTPANVIFCVFTHGKAQGVHDIQNGYLGWHYVNSVDTCVYYSQPIPFDIGVNTITWDGSNQDLEAVDPDTYSYYLWGYDNISNKQLATEAFHSSGIVGGLSIIEYDESGSPRSNPWVVCHDWYEDNNRAVVNLTVQKKWILGNDPVDMDLAETTHAVLTDSYVYDKLVALDPDDQNYFFQSGGLNRTQGEWKGVWRMKWVPNGDAILQTEWGDNGFAGVEQIYDANMGPLADGNYVYYVNQNYHGYNDDIAESELYVIDNPTGDIVSVMDLSYWWCDIEDFNRGGADQRGAEPNIRTEWLSLPQQPWFVCKTNGELQQPLRSFLSLDKPERRLYPRQAFRGRF